MPYQNEKPSEEIITPNISLPKGGGAVKGIDEKFTVNPATGTLSTRIPIEASSGRSDFFPKLSLAYNSGAGNGPFGSGWDLSIPSITRKTDRGLPRYVDGVESDTFILSGAEDLVPVQKKNAGTWISNGTEDRTSRYFIRRYRPRIDGLFARIERWEQKGSKDVHWRSISKDNITSIYGYSPEARIADKTGKKVFSWLLEQSFDDKGNLISYQYTKDKAYDLNYSPSEKNRTDATNTYIKNIHYGNTVQLDNEHFEKLNYTGEFHFKLVFDYGDHSLPGEIVPDKTWDIREDAFSNFRSGFEIRTRRICHRILMFHNFPQENIENTLVKSTDLFYDPGSVITYLISFTHTGYIKRDHVNGYIAKSNPPTEFTYTRAEIDKEIKSIDQESLDNLPVGLDNRQYQWIDLDGEGISGVLTEQSNQWFYKRNLGNGTFAPLELLTTPSTASLYSDQQQFMDLAGNGSLDRVMLSKAATGFYERDKEKGWCNFKPFSSIPNVNWQDPNLRLIDLNGDGHADILITEDEVFTWYASMREDGFAPSQSVIKDMDEENGPALVFADFTQSIYLSDMSGDGLIDILRIKNNDICYWPNLGYGKFGGKITMGNPPCFDTKDQFNHTRIRLSDIDGSGTTDIIYLGGEKISIWFNQSGNSWSDAQEIDCFPVTDNLSTVMVADLTGNGTASLIFSSPLLNYKENPLLYMDLMGNQKPHLLNSVKNNMGSETRFYYASSTQFYLNDQKEEKPWITKLPFPVHVLKKVETIDHLSSVRLATSYKYHHGCFDGQEREFRGFGMVEQLDTEFFDQDNEAGGGREFFVPPVHTKTWFHTGSFQNRDHISNQYISEYYNKDPDGKLLEDTLLPSMDMTAREIKEACRALKGRPLRKEIYALDNSEKSIHPYQVTENNYKIKMLQPTENNPHAVFFTHENEILNYHYERNPLDPRISHNMILEADEDYGNIKKTASIVYPRRQGADGPEHEPEQSKTIITYTESEFINLDDGINNYMTGIPYEIKNYEVTGLNAEGTDIFIFAEIDRIKDFSSLKYNEIPTEGLEQKRVIEHSRNLYARNDFLAPLELGEADFPVLPYESYKLALTPEIINDLSISITDTMLHEDAGYKFWDESWWIPSGRQLFDPAQFYLPIKQIDPFDNEFKIKYDDYCLLMESIEDPYGNKVRSKSNYRVLQPYLLTDPNDNRSEVAFDILGMVVGKALMGKDTGEINGDSLEGFNPDIDAQTIQTIIDHPFENSHEILQQATTCLIYDIWRFYNTSREYPGDKKKWQPVVIYTMNRETHVSDLKDNEQTKIQHSFLYSDGFGREIQEKNQAEPGEANGEYIEKRWISTGTTVFNNKGKPVKQYEPFFSTTHHFCLEQHGVSPVVFYDSLERVTATLHPNHTYEKVVFNPWFRETWDANDTLSQNHPNSDQDVGFYFDLLPDNYYLPTWHDKMKTGTPAEQTAADQALKHADTPAILKLDVQGRPFLEIVDNGLDQEGFEQKYETRTRLDIEGKPLEITDPRNNRVISYQYDIAGRQIFQNSMDAGKSWMLINAAENPVYTWDSKGNKTFAQYDRLQRPTHLYVKEPEDASEKGYLAEHTIHGEEKINAKEFNLVGQIYKQYDGAGIVTNEHFDFKGNLFHTTRQLIKEYQDHTDWLLAPELEDEVFITSTSYDALNRPQQIITPHTETVPANKILPGYNEANLLEKVDACLRGSKDITSFVTNIDYNEKGQRIKIEYGNSAKTEYTYDSETFRLTHLKTSSDSNNADLQDLHYTYDPVGNITEISDNAHKTIFYNNQEVKPCSQYQYDALYRLILADGREHSGQHADRQPDHNPFPTIDTPHPNDPQAMRRYTQEYFYDETDNILQMIHRAQNGGGNWNRCYQYSQENNRLLSTSGPGDPKKETYIIRSDFESSSSQEYSFRYNYDSHGNMTYMPHLVPMEWDFKDQLHMAQQAVINGEPPVKSYYTYDASGERVKKVVIKNSGSIKEERIYLGGFEIFRKWTGDDMTEETETLHITDDQKCIAIVETKTVKDGHQQVNPISLSRYQIDNHLGSSSLELNKNGETISYEEYYPFGTTSYQSRNHDISQKRYRYTGKERDEETGLYYYGARYYAAWLGRWASTDPAMFVDGYNLYVYTTNNPIRFIDKKGEKEIQPFLPEELKREDITRAINIFSKSDISKTNMGQKVCNKLNELMEEDEIGIEVLPHGLAGVFRHGSPWGKFDLALNKNQSLNQMITKIIHEGVHAVLEDEDIHHIDDELAAFGFEAKYYAELKKGKLGVDINSNKNRALEGVLARMKENCLVDSVIGIEKYAKHLTIDWIVNNIDRWGGISNRDDLTRQQYIIKLAQKGEKHLDLIDRLALREGKSRLKTLGVEKTYQEVMKKLKEDYGFKPSKKPKP